jgi:hypothetical protein
MIDFLKDGFSKMEPLYQLEKDGKLDPSKPGSKEGRAFLDKQLRGAGQMLGDLWLTAWREAPEDKYLSGQLITRKNGGQE